MEQWVQAARQKEEDSMALASYTKSDTSRIKELQLEETKASKELASLEHLLENEMSETQSHQIQLDRTAEEFRYQNFPHSCHYIMDIYIHTSLNFDLNKSIVLCCL
jgi:hypothetical protein